MRFRGDEAFHNLIGVRPSVTKICMWFVPGSVESIRHHTALLLRHRPRVGMTVTNRPRIYVGLRYTRKTGAFITRPFTTSQL